jgi:hypothetical protein
MCNVDADGTHKSEVLLLTSARFCYHSSIGIIHEMDHSPDVVLQAFGLTTSTSLVQMS